MRCAVPILLLLVACDCGRPGGMEVPEVDPAPEAPPAPRAEPAPQLPGYPLVDTSQLGQAPARYAHVVPRLSPPTGFRFRNLIYEANNMTLRGPRGEDEFYESTGNEIAQRWREGAAGVRKVFALRDALFSQQDHPIDHDPVAVMMPPSWVSVAVAEAMAGRPIEPLRAPPVDSDDEWEAIATPRELFGVFPYSERLHREATRPRTVLAPDRLRVTNARRTVRSLAADAQAMVDAAGQGPEAVAAAGAERISRADRLYFGERLRRENMILISVENPNHHELVEEAKGLRVHGRELPDEAVQLALVAIYRRRLADGDLAVERYDLGRREERERAIAMLEAVIPHDEPVAGEGRLWLWVHGGLDARGVSGRDATPFIAGFRAEVAEANIDVDRLDYLSKPHVRIGGTHVSAQLDMMARRYGGLDLPLSLNVGSRLLARLFEELEARRLRRESREAAEAP